MSAPTVSIPPSLDEPLLIPIKEEYQPIEAPRQVSLLKGQIILNPGISLINFLSYGLFFTLTGIFMIPIGLLTVPLLSVVYGLDLSQRADVSSLDRLCQLAQKFITTPILGYICDRFGRKPMLLLGTCLTVLGTVALPNLPNVYPCYILNGLVMEIGLATMMTAPLLADYIDDRTKGRVAGLVAVALYISSFTVTYLNENADLRHNIQLKYYELAGVAGLMFLIAAFGLKGGKYHLKQAKNKIPEDALKIDNHVMSQGVTQACSDDAMRFNNSSTTGDFNPVDPNAAGSNFGGSLRINGSVADQIEARLSREGEALANPVAAPPAVKNEPLSMIVGFKQLKNPWLMVGCVGHFLAMACVSLLNTLLSNYVAKRTGDDTSNQAIILTNKHLLSAIFSALFCGYFADKLDRFVMMVVVILISIGAVLMLILAPTVFHWMAYASMVFFGFSTGGFVTLGSQIFSKYPNPKFRASVAAAGGMFSMFGSSAIGILGMFLMKYDAEIPFYMYIGFSGIGLGVLTVLYIVKHEELKRLR